MSTASEVKLSVFDSWVLREAMRVIGDNVDRETAEPVAALLRAIGASSDPPDGFDAMLHRFREHSDARKAFDEESNHHKAEAAKLETLLVEQFGANGTQSIKRDGKTFFLQREFSATAVPDQRQALVEVMRELGHDEMIVVQPQRLASWCREMLGDEATGLPEEVKPLVRIHEAMRLRMRAS